MTLLILENLDETNHRKLFSIMGTDYVMTSLGWLNIPMMIGAGILVAWFLAPVEGIQNIILSGIAYGLLMLIASFCHGLGHIISSKMAGAPMTKLIGTITVHTTYYDDNEEDNISSKAHMMRAIGGPVLNLVLGILMLVINASIFPSHFILFFGVINLVFFAITISPLPSLDGAVLLREMRKSSK